MTSKVSWADFATFWSAYSYAGLLSHPWLHCQIIFKEEVKFWDVRVGRKCKFVHQTTLRVAASITGSQLFIVLMGQFGKCGLVTGICYIHHNRAFSIMILSKPEGVGWLKFSKTASRIAPSSTEMTTLWSLGSLKVKSMWPNTYQRTQETQCLWCLVWEYQDSSHCNRCSVPHGRKRSLVRHLPKS